MKYHLYIIILIIPLLSIGRTLSKQFGIHTKTKNQYKSNLTNSAIKIPIKSIKKDTVDNPKDKNIKKIPPSKKNAHIKSVDSLQTAQNDSIPKINKIKSVDSLQTAQNDSIPKKDKKNKKNKKNKSKSAEFQKSKLNNRIMYKAQDTIITYMQKKRITLYGNSEVKYDDFELKSYMIDIDYERSLLIARPHIDSLGKVTEKPSFKQGGKNYQTDSMEYNFKRKKAIIYGVVTKQGEGVLVSKKLEKNKYDEIYAHNSKYCPCEDITEGTYFKTNKIKIGKKKQIITGPSHLYIGDTPTPIWIPFGIFPSPKANRSGILFPSYGEIRERGFFLQNGGYYWYINDYMDMKLQGSIYTRGGWESDLAFNYKKRYRYNGSLNLSYNTLVSQGEVSNAGSNTFWLRWTHKPTPRGNSTFSANLNLGSTTYNNNTINLQSSAEELQRRSTNNFNSNMTYTQKISQGLFNLTVAARHSQNSSTDVITATLPSFNLSMKQLNPFKFKNSIGSHWYDKIAWRYSVKGTNNLSNSISTLSLGGVNIYNAEEEITTPVGFFSEFPTVLNNRKLGIQHDTSLSISLKVFNHFTLSPNISYKERWYEKRYSYEYVGGYDAEGKENGVKVNTINNFSRAYDFSTSLGISTNIYGIKTISNPNRRLKAIRHHIQPSISISWRPDFSEPAFDFYQNTVINEKGETELLSRYIGAVYGVPGKGKSGTISFNLRNVLEAKVTPKNKPEEKAEKIKIIESFTFSTSYNLFAEEYKLSNANWAIRNSFLKGKLSLQVSGVLDPYSYRVTSVSDATTITQEKIDEIRNIFVGEFWQLSSARFLISTRMSPDFFKGTSKDNKKNTRPTFSNKDDNTRFNSLNLPYIDWSLPWSLSVSYTANYSKTGFLDSTFTHNVQFNGDVTLAKKWKLTFSSAYDFQASELTSSNVAISRDLGCWVMSFNWVPFGRFTSYNFNLNVKAQMLKDLKYTKTSTRNF